MQVYFFIFYHKHEINSIYDDDDSVFQYLDFDLFPSW